MSSGTSGNKGIVITTKEEENYIKAMYASRLVLPKGEKNCAFILRVNTPAFNYNQSGNKLTYINQLQPMGKTIEQLENLNPNIVSAPPSMLKLLAAEVQAGRLKIIPKLVYAYAEVLYPEVKEHLEKAKNMKIIYTDRLKEGVYYEKN